MVCLSMGILKQGFGQRMFNQLGLGKRHWNLATPSTLRKLNSTFVPSAPIIPSQKQWASTSERCLTLIENRFCLLRSSCLLSVSFWILKVINSFSASTRRSSTCVEHEKITLKLIPIATEYFKLNHLLNCHTFSLSHHLIGEWIFRYNYHLCVHSSMKVWVEQLTSSDIIISSHH